MKFGRELHRFLIAHWTPYYINYSGLKARYKCAAKISLEQGRPIDLSEFTDTLTSERSKVVSFYSAQLDALHRRVNTLFHQYSILNAVCLAYANKFELIDILAELNDIRRLLQQLHWYGFVNFEKILIKVTKFSAANQPSVDLQELMRSNLDIQAECGQYLTVVIQRLTSTSKANEGPQLELLLPSLWQERYDSSFREHVDTAIHAVRDDDNSLLELTLEHEAGKQALHQDESRLFEHMLFDCIMLQSRSCLEYLLRYTRYFSENSKHLARLIIKLGRISCSELCDCKPVEDLVTAIDLPRATEQFLDVIHQASNHCKLALYHEDSSGRLPLHHAVQYRLNGVCVCILEQMMAQDSSIETISTAPALIEDKDYTSPLKLAVLIRNAPLTEVLLRSLSVPSVAKSSSLNELTVLSIKLGSFTILQLMLSTGVDITFRSYNNETALYVAVKSGWTQAIRAVLKVIGERAPAAIDLPEAVREWTPLMLACVRGDKSCMDLLLQHGADLGKKDQFGWTAKDHAAYRGWESMALLLTSLEPPPSKGHRHPQG